MGALLLAGMVFLLAGKPSGRTTLTKLSTEYFTMHKHCRKLTLHIRARPQPFGKDWQWMDEFRVLRNWMAHNGGKVQQDTNSNGNWVKAKRFVRRNRGVIKFERFGEIIVNDQLVDRAVEKATCAISAIENAVQRLYV